MNMQEEYPDFFGDTPIYSAECFKQNIHMRENSYAEIITLEIINTLNSECKVTIND
jgi:hypothetical protein